MVDIPPVPMLEFDPDRTPRKRDENGFMIRAPDPLLRRIGSPVFPEIGIVRPGEYEPTGCDIVHPGGVPPGVERIEKMMRAPRPDPLPVQTVESNGFLRLRSAVVVIDAERRINKELRKWNRVLR